MIKHYTGPAASGFLAVYLSLTPYLKMKKFGYAAAGAICAVLMFVFVILPRMEPVEAATNVPNYELIEEENTECPGPCHTWFECSGSCDEKEGEECCEQGLPEDNGACSFC